MKQLFKAVDSLDRKLSYFYYDGLGRQTTISASILTGDNHAIYIFKEMGRDADWLASEDHMARMIKPVLLAEW